MTHVAVLAGGWSREREETLASGTSCAEALRGAGYDVTQIDVDHDLAIKLAELRPDVVFNALRGGHGENGSVQGVLETLQLPYTHSGVLPSALAMDKHQSKIMFKSAGIPVTDHTIANRAEIARAHVMPPPYVIKPISQVARAGVFLVGAGDEHPPQEILAADWRGGEELMVERFIPGCDLACAVMGDVALGVAEVKTELEFDNNDAKIQQGAWAHVIPAPISPKIYEKVQNISLKAHEALGCRGVTQTDFRFNGQAGENGELVCLEINTQPSVAPLSLVPELAAHAGHSFEELVSWMVEDASCNR